MLFSLPTGVVDVSAITPCGFKEVNHGCRIRQRAVESAEEVYDAVLVSGVAAYLAVFTVLTKLLFPRVTDEIMLIRAFWHRRVSVVTHHSVHRTAVPAESKVPAAALQSAARRGDVLLLGLIHAVLVVATYHAGSDTNPILSILSPVLSPARRAQCHFNRSAFSHW